MEFTEGEMYRVTTPISAIPMANNYRYVGRSYHAPHDLIFRGLISELYHVVTQEQADKLFRGNPKEGQVWRSDGIPYEVRVVEVTERHVIFAGITAKDLRSVRALEEFKGKYTYVSG